MRLLVHIPIIHTAADLGSLSAGVAAHYLKECGPLAWDRREQAVATLWNAIREEIALLNLDYRKVRIYQDGLPVCGFELEIARELARAGSCNHQLLLDLISEGATLVGTEDPQLLIREYELQQQGLAGSTDPDQARAHSAAEAQRLLEARDRFIAARIGETLQPGETGLLFLGAAHRPSVQDYPDIRLETLGPPAAPGA